MDVAHIPLAVRDNPPVGYYGYFTNADVLARATDGKYTPAFDRTTITPEQNTQMIDDVSWLLSRHIEAQLVDGDLDVESLNKLHALGIIEEHKVLITSCYFKNEECGKTEFQAIDDDRKFVSNKHQLSRDNCCSLCDTKLETNPQTVLLLDIPDITDDIRKISTPYLKHNVTELAQKFNGQKLLINRLRQTNISWNGYNIDNDFSNYTSLAHAIDSSRNDSLLYFASHNTSFALMSMMAISTVLDQDNEFNVIAIPKITFTDGKGNETKVTLEGLQNAGVSRSAITLVLLQSLGSNSNHISIPSREFGMAQRRLSSVSAIDAIYTNSERLRDSDDSLIIKGIPNRQVIGTVLKELISHTSDLKNSRKNLLTARVIGCTIQDIEV